MHRLVTKPTRLIYKASHSIMKKISNDIYSAGQLSPNELRKEISDHGIKTVINIRGLDEEGYIDESEICKQAGVKYSHHGTSKDVKQWNQQLGDTIVKDLSESPKPILIHCASSIRSTTFALLREAKDKGVDFEKEADRVGLQGEGFRNYGKEYLGKQ